MSGAVTTCFLCEAHPATIRKERQTIALNFMGIEYSDP
jgi:hypothetical protein